MSADPTNLDWSLADSTTDGMVISNIMEGLTRIDENLKPVPALAQRWTVSEDGRTYRFFLRSGLKWSDGKPFKAEHFVDGWKRVLSSFTASPHAFLLYIIENAKLYHQGALQDFSKVGIHAASDTELVVTLARPTPHWLFLTSLWPLYPIRLDVVNQSGNLWTRPGNIVVVGPYIPVIRDIGTKWVLAANKEYYLGAPKVQQVELIAQPSDDAAFASYKAGEFDVLLDPSVLSAEIKSRPDLKVFRSFALHYLGLATGRYPMTSLGVRKAVAMAIDRKALGESLGGLVEAATSVVPRGIAGFSHDMGLPFDAKAARQELVKSGARFDAKSPLQILVRNFGLQVLAANAAAEQLRRNLQIPVEVKIVENKDWLLAVQQKAFTTFLGRWVGGFPDSYDYLSPFYHRSMLDWNNAEYIRGIDMLEGMTDAAARTKLALKLQKTLIEQDAAVLPLFYGKNRALVSPRVMGFRVMPSNRLIPFKEISLK